jgi:hypothetical protein
MSTGNRCLSVVLLAIVLKVIPHAAQRYDTVGDWRWQGDTLQIRVSREVGAKNPDFITLVFVHEAIEAILCRHDGITTSQVDAFDMAFKGDAQPGDDPAAPYHRQHQAAERIERQLATALGVKWSDYEKALDRIHQ